MDSVTTWFSGGGLALLIVSFIVRSILEKYKEKEQRLNKNDIHNTIQDHRLTSVEKRLDKIENEKDDQKNCKYITKDQ